MRGPWWDVRDASRRRERPRSAASRQSAAGLAASSLAAAAARDGAVEPGVGVSSRDARRLTKRGAARRSGRDDGRDGRVGHVRHVLTRRSDSDDTSENTSIERSGRRAAGGGRRPTTDDRRPTTADRSRCRCRRAATIPQSQHLQRSMKSYTRRTHRKTRTGCVSCKRRKIKCGEQKPTCGNCVRHNITCDYAVAVAVAVAEPETPSPGSDGGIGSASASGGAGGGASASASASASSCRSPPPLPPPPPPPPPPPDDAPLNLADLELLHNFSTATFATLSSDPVLRALWRSSVPQLGFAHDFVMRGILAFSALHLAHCRGQPRYLARADAHHQAGLRQASALLPRVDAANCSALYIFSALSALFAIARSRVAALARASARDLLLFGTAGFPDWLVLFRGTRSVIEAQFAHLSTGVLGPMFVAGWRRAQLRDDALAVAVAVAATRPPSAAELALAELRAYVGRTLPAADASNGDFVAYNAAIDELQRSFASIYGASGPLSATTETADVFIWLFRISDRYLALLQQHTQPSLAILAFFCTLSHHLESNWWIQGWSGLLMGQIWDALDEEHRLLVHWPAEEIGWLRRP